MIRRLFLLLFCFATVLFFPVQSLAAESAVLDDTVMQQEQASDATIFMFVRADCGHCKDAKAFLATFLPEHPGVSVQYYDLEDDVNKEKFDSITSKYDLVKGTPLTLINGVLVQGFGTADTTGEVFRTLVANPSLNASFEDVIDGVEVTVYSGTSQTEVCTEEGCEITNDTSYKIRVPIIGTVIDVGGFSLATLSLVLGFVDGFNPCALWVLVMFLFVLSQVGSKRRMIEYAGLFIVAETVMYYLILNVWFTAWDFIELNKYVTPGVGLLALGSGAYFLYKFFTYTPTCTVASPEQQKKISDRVKELASKPMTFGVALGILALAFSVNIFEFACSIGIPQTFTKILELNFLSFWETQGYMFLYILMYMVDDFIVFGIGIYAMEKIGVVHKYSKWSTLLGAICMLLLGLIMLLKPELLVF